MQKYPIEKYYLENIHPDDKKNRNLIFKAGYFFNSLHFLYVTLQFILHVLDHKSNYPVKHNQDKISIEIIHSDQ